MLAVGYAWARGGPGDNPGQGRVPEFVEGELIVKYKSNVSTEDKALHLRAHGAGLVKELKDTGLRRVKLPPGMAVSDAVKKFREDPGVEYAEPNYIVRAELVPNDTLYSQQWNMVQISTPLAWDILNSAPEVVVAVVDTGVDYRHPDLAANIWHNPGEVCPNGTDDDANGYIDDCIGWDFRANDSDPMEGDTLSAHGTHVAGIVGAQGNNARGVAGTSWKVKIMPLRFLPASGVGNIFDAIEAIVYARKMGADVINCSWGSDGAFSQALKDAIEATPALFVCAAGNDGEDTDIVTHVPSGYESANILSVAATTISDTIASYSNFGLVSVDVAAPGGDDAGKILSTVYGHRSKLMEEGFDSTGGTLPGGWTSNGTWDVTGAFSNSPAYSLADSPGVGNPYLGLTNSIINSPAINLSLRNDCSLYYTLKLDTEPADSLHVEAASNLAGPWTSLSGHSGSTAGFSTFVDSLSPAFNDTYPVYIRFRLEASTGNPTGLDGAYIDDVRVLCLDLTPEYSELSGTSMAAPHAAGVAALLIGNVPGLSPVEAKFFIMNSVDQKTSLIDKAVTGGRINAQKALLSLDAAVKGLSPPSAPTGLAASAASSFSIALNWMDTSNDEALFIIERAKGTGAFIEVETAAADTTSFTDGGLMPATRYTYRVKSFNGKSSGYSNEASATTHALSSDDGCFIATAAYGSRLAPEVDALRAFRDERLLNSEAGRRAVEFYYRHSPALARFISKRLLVRQAARVALTPVVYGVKNPGAASALALGILAAASYAAIRYSRTLRRRKH